MTTHTTLNKDLSNLLTELQDYITANEIDYLAPPPITNLGDVVKLCEDLPSLNSLLADLDLTLADAKLYGVYREEIVSKSNVPFLIIPFKNFGIMSLSINEPKAKAKAETVSAINHTYYYSSDTDLVEKTKFLADTVYLVNSDAYHAYSYDSFAESPEEFGAFLLLAVNEDISNYFA